MFLKIMQLKSTARCRSEILLADGTLIRSCAGAELAQNCLAKATFSELTGDISNTGACSDGGEWSVNGRGRLRPRR